MKISLCLSCDYSHITYVNIFVHKLAESTHFYLPFQSILHILYLLYIYLGWYFTYLLQPHDVYCVLSKLNGFVDIGTFIHFIVCYCIFNWDLVQWFIWLQLKRICISEILYTSISHQLFVYTITFVNSQH